MKDMNENDSLESNTNEKYSSRNRGGRMHNKQLQECQKNFHEK